MEASARLGLARLGSVRLGMAELEAAWLGGLARHTRADSVAAVRISARLLLATSQHGRSPDEQTHRVMRKRKRGQHAVAQVDEQVGVVGSFVSSPAENVGLTFLETPHVGPAWPAFFL
ncbi:hypothetical protein PaG_06358 [Moesziomyces aphidis]|jgi:hypothetical protein|uniref:Uncharacterized protein n=1 Tax=Moesziomyces aphidis TaxID=84754 RepID=W3VFC0_MOEAP|nr:hypothetical protein PaG_06358 [Moesziomyces aphidis]